MAAPTSSFIAHGAKVTGMKCTMDIYDRGTLVCKGAAAQGTVETLTENGRSIVRVTIDIDRGPACEAKGPPPGPPTA